VFLKFESKYDVYCLSSGGASPAEEMLLKDLLAFNETRDLAKCHLVDVELLFMTQFGGRISNRKTNYAIRI